MAKNTTQPAPAPIDQPDNEGIPTDAAGRPLNEDPDDAIDEEPTDPDAPAPELPFSAKAPPRSDEPEMTGALMTIPLVHVLVMRDATVSMPTTVFEWEIPVLQAIHGDDNVIDTGEEDDIEVPEMTATQAYYAMLRKYAQHENEVKSVYPTAHTLARHSGLEFRRSDNLDPRGKGSLVIDHRKAARAARQG